ncbi:hypothetical protein PQR14_00885 [Paraburkholderia bryophila]|uniref:hypothetical protein n=1 Tax=Burkholderiaceae TaxID=119060 RepID=UPI00054D64F6|nr:MULTISPECIES: hypothetical protein [Burkholderiaceae]
MGNVFIVALACAGALFFYCSMPGQRWLRAPLPALPARCAAAVCVALSVGCAASALQPVTSLSVVVTTLMASLTVYPFVGALIERTRFRRAAR